MVVYCTNMMNSATSEVQLGIQYKFKELCHQSRAFHHGIHLSIKLHSTTFSKDTNLQFICETEYIWNKLQSFPYSQTDTTNPNSAGLFFKVTICTILCIIKYNLQLVNSAKVFPSIFVCGCTFSHCKIKIARIYRLVHGKLHVSSKQNI